MTQTHQALLDHLWKAMAAPMLELRRTSLQAGPMFMHRTLQAVQEQGISNTSCMMYALHTAL